MGATFTARPIIFSELLISVGGRENNRFLKGLIPSNFIVSNCQK